MGNELRAGAGRYVSIQKCGLKYTMHPGKACLLMVVSKAGTAPHGYGAQARSYCGFASAWRTLSPFVPALFDAIDSAESKLFLD